MRVWVEAASAIFIEEIFWNQQVNPQKLVVFHGDAKKIKNNVYVSVNIVIIEI